MLKYFIYLILAAILQCPAIHKKKPPIHGYRRAKVNRKRESFALNPWN